MSGRSTKSAEPHQRISEEGLPAMNVRREGVADLNICRSEKNLNRSKSLGSCRGVSGTGGAAGCFCATDFFLLRARICKQLTPKISMECCRWGNQALDVGNLLKSMLGREMQNEIENLNASMFFMQQILDALESERAGTSSPSSLSQRD
nr:hypothetical protein Iba_chr06cCG13750 [Ipomoea batatas]